MPRVNQEDCPRCGCWVVEEFKCGCGQIHADVCANCGRYAAPALRRDQYAEPDEMIPRCSLGQVLHKHEHDWEALVQGYLTRRNKRARG